MIQKTEPNNPLPNRNKDHDDFVKGLFSYTEFVFKILQYALPSDLKAYIDFSTLKESSETHVDEVLQMTYSDTIYEANLKKSEIPKSLLGRKRLPNFRFCFLGEFKSSIPARPIDFQIQDYVKSIQIVDINSDQPPSVVIPILIYHGAKKWQHKRLYDYFAKYLPETYCTVLFFQVIDNVSFTNINLINVLK